MDEKMANTSDVKLDDASVLTSKSWLIYLIVALVAGAICLGCSVSPPSLMDDVDGAVAQIARNMVTSSDWVTPRADGIAFLETPAMFYWPIAVSFKIFGIHDWAARIPFALSAIGLACLTCAFGTWAFGRRAGLGAGLCMATCVGLFLFTRIVIPDVMLTLTIMPAMWALLRALDEEEPHPQFWAFVLAASLGVGVLLKSLIGAIFSIAIGLLYLFLTKQAFVARTWKRLRPISGFFIPLLVAAPWHVLAARRNPPYFYFGFHGGPGEYHGFLWFYFINEQVLRFLNLRYPRDYNTVPRVWFWLFHFLWLFPWSVYFPTVAKLSFRPVDRAGRARLLTICWIGFILVFFTLSTTQEYYSMPCYPAMALLLGSAMAEDGNWIRRGTHVLSAITGCAALACITIFFLVRNLPAPGDISSALGHHPSVYTLSLGHMMDLTFDSNRDALNLNGRYFNLEYGSYAPGAPDVFIDDARFKSLWYEPHRYYLVAYQSELKHFEELIGRDHLHIVTASGGKVLLTNHALGHTSPAEGIPHLSGASKTSLQSPWCTGKKKEVQSTAVF